MRSVDAGESVEAKEGEVEAGGGAAGGICEGGRGEVVGCRKGCMSVGAAAWALSVGGVGGGDVKRRVRGPADGSDDEPCCVGGRDDGSARAWRPSDRLGRRTRSRPRRASSKPARSRGDAKDERRCRRDGGGAALGWRLPQAVVGGDTTPGHVGGDGDGVGSPDASDNGLTGIEKERAGGVVGGRPLRGARRIISGGLQAREKKRGGLG